MLFKFVASLAVVFATAASAEVVSETLPTPDNPHGWRTAAFQLASYDYDANELTMETNTGGVFFGTELGGWSWGGWQLGSSSQGNQLSLTARFREGSRDWSAYVADGNYYAGIQFGPGNHGDKNCDWDLCYEDPFFEGVALTFAPEFGSSEYVSTFVDLDTQVNHDFGFLLKDGLVSYTIDGQTYSGYAYSANYRILVIGDGSGSTHTGLGAMTIGDIAFDNAPRAAVVLPPPVPEPATWVMMLGGFGLIGAALRSRRRAAGLAL